MLELFLDNRASVQNALAFVLFVAAFWKGGGPERALGATVFGMVVAEFGYHALFGPAPSFHRLDLWHSFLDAAGLAAFLAIALHANRFYPLIIAAAQLVAFTSHIVRALVEPVSSLSYYLLFSIPFWFQMLILGIGIARHARRTRVAGPYRDWRGGAARQVPMGYP